jgi:GxxExxY protein
MHNLPFFKGSNPTTNMNEDTIASEIVDAALKIHRHLGPGLLESVYETILAYELTKKGLGVERQKAVPIFYEGIEFPDPFRIDLLIEGKVLVELKSVEKLLPVHYRQAVTYLRLAHLPAGLLINFNVPLLKQGLHRLVDGLGD